MVLINILFFIFTSPKVYVNKLCNYTDKSNITSEYSKASLIQLAALSNTCQCLPATPVNLRSKCVKGSQIFNLQVWEISWDYLFLPFHSEDLFSYSPLISLLRWVQNRSNFRNIATRSKDFFTVPCLFEYQYSTSISINHFYFLHQKVEMH